MVKNQILKPPQMTILSDHAVTTEDDFLSLESRLSVVLDILRHRHTCCPIAIAIYGDWGTGKTSAMRWLEVQLNRWNKKNSTDRDAHPRVYPVWFDPWKYHSREAVWRGIVAEVILSLFRVSKLDRQNFGIRITEAAKKFGAFLGKGFLHALANTELTLKAEAKTPAAKVAPEVKFSGEMFRDIYSEFEKSNHPEKAHLNQFEESLKQWVKDFLTQDERLAIFIDDLDRCLPEVTLEVLEAIKLYLNIPQIMFVAGLDRAVVNSVVIKHYDTHGLGKEKARQYLDKIFQVEIQIPPSEQQMEKFLNSQILALDKLTNGYWESNLQESHRQALMQAIQRLAKHNPRETKRLLNSSLLLGRAAADNTVLISSSGDTEKDRQLRFAQGIQLFLLQRLLQEQSSNVSRLLIEEKSLKWFKRASEFASSNLEFIPRLDNFILRYGETEKGDRRVISPRRWRLGPAPSEYGLNEKALYELDILIEGRPRDDVGRLLELPLMCNEILWILLRVPFSVAVAQFVPVTTGAKQDSFEIVEPSYPSQKALVGKAITMLEEAFTGHGAPGGLATGYIDFDRLTGGLNASEVTVFATNSILRATTLALNIVSHVAVETKLPVAFFSPNTSSESLTLRMILLQAELNPRTARDGILAESDFPKLTTSCGKLANCSLFMDDTPIDSVREFYARARKLWKLHGIRLLIIDSFEAFNPSNNQSQNERETTEISAAVKSLAEELRIPVMWTGALPQPAQRVGRKPNLSDFRQSGLNERYLDTIALMYDPNGEDEDIMLGDVPAVPINLLIAKQMNGPTGEIPLLLRTDCERIESPPPVDKDDPP